MESEQILNGVFKIFSGTCVHNPFEVIIIILSICISLSLLSSSSSSSIPTASPLNLKVDLNQVGFENSINVNDNLKSLNPVSYFNFSFLMLLRCLAFACIFVQLKNLKKVHSKFVLTISIIFTLISSVIFNNALLSWFNFEIPNNLLLIIDIVIYTLVLIDLKKCNMILNNALEMKSIKEAKSNIVHNFAYFASNSSLDTFFLILLVALGNLSDSHEIKNFSLFSCMLLSSNFLIFITIYPALLSLILQFKKKTNNSSKLSPNDKCESTNQQIDQQSSSHLSASDSKQNQNNNNNNRTNNLVFSTLNNPVLVYVKILMTIFLIIIHLKLKFFSEKGSASSSTLKNDSIVNGKLIQDEDMLSKQAAQNQRESIIFYTECCLLITLVIYVLSKFFKENKNDELNNQAKEKQNLPETKTIYTQTESFEQNKVETVANDNCNKDFNLNNIEKRPVSECLSILKQRQNQTIDDFLDSEVIDLVNLKHIPLYKLESYFSNPTRGVRLRRSIVEKRLIENSINTIPFENYDYSKVLGSCCENIIGYVPIPLGTAGPLLIDNVYYQIPMATTEGTLVASTNRGCNALSASQGVFTKVLSDGMTRGPALKFPSAMKAAEVKEWLDNDENFLIIKKAFDSTSRFAKLDSTKCCVVGRYLYIRFTSTTGDAMGMNMLSKGSERALIELQKYFNEAQIISLSGNYCTDKKSSAINWIEGRGKSVVCEATVKGDIVKSVLKTSAKALVDLNLTKNLVGSAMAGSIGGFNAHAANIVAAVFIACGQDPAQVVESSNCLTWMECTGNNLEDLYISCTMPSLEVGTVGGGTILDAQSSCLKMLGVFGSNVERPGENASTLARIIAATVLAGELSLMSALASGHLVNSHMRYNRSVMTNLNQAASKGIHNVL